MAIKVNNHDLNMPTLGGMALEYTEGLNLPLDLYVFGLSDDTAGMNPLHIDSVIRDSRGRNIAPWIVKFLSTKGVKCKLGLQGKPKMRPAVGVSYTVRNNRIDYATRACVFVLLTMNGLIKIPKKDLDKLEVLAIPKKKKKNVIFDPEPVMPVDMDAELQAYLNDLD